MDKKNNNMRDKIKFDFLSIRTINCLQKAGIHTNKKLLETSPEELLRLPNFGIKCLDEINKYLLIFNFKSSSSNNYLDFNSVVIPGSLGCSINIVNQDILDQPINEDMFSVRVYRCLIKLEIKSIKDLLRKTPAYFLKIDNFGKSSLRSIVKIISEMDKQVSMLKNVQDGQLRKINAFDVMKTLIISICPDFRLDVKSIKKYIPKDVSISNHAITEMIKYFDNYSFLLSRWNNSRIRLFRSIVDKIQDRNMLIFKSRMADPRDPLTLKDISDKVGITRERVRQISVGITKNLNKYFLKKILITYLEKHINFIRKNGGIITEDKCLRFAIKEDLLINKDIFLLMICAYNHICDANIYLLTIDGVNYISEFNRDSINSAYNELRDEYENLYGLTKEQMREFLKLDETYSQEIEDACISLFINNEAIIKNGKLVGIKNKTMLNFTYLVKRYTKGAHLKKIIEAYSLCFNNGGYQESVRGYFERCENVILWGRGSYIHSDNIDVNFDDFYRIYEKINHAMLNIENKTSVGYIFHSNRNLMKYLNIPSAQALYSVLRMDSNDKFIYRRYPDIEKSENARANRKKHIEEINSFFLNAGKEVFWSQLASYFINKRGLVFYQITAPIQRSKKIYRIGVGRWIHVDHLNINKKKIQKIIFTLKKNFNNKKYLLIDDLLKKMQLPNIAPFHWNRTLLASIINKNSDYRVISNVAVVSLGVDTLKTIEDLVLDKIKSSSFRFSRSSLEMYIRQEKITTNPNFLCNFVSKYGHLLEN